MNQIKTKICCIFNLAAHYRAPIYKLMDKELHCDFYFGNRTASSMQLMDYSELKGFKKTLQYIPLLGNFYFQKGVVPIAFKPYKHFILTGEPHCISTWIVLLILRIRGKKTYLWTHGWYGRETIIKKTIKKIFFSLGSKVLLYGDFARNLMLKEGFKSNKLICIYNSLDYDSQIAFRTAIKPSPFYANHFKNNFHNLIFVGRLTKVKQLDLLLKALAKLKVQSNYFNLIIIGGGEQQDELLALSKELGINENVWFYGVCFKEKELSELLFNADLCISPGNVGLTAIHAMVYGTPVITHNNYQYQMPEFEAIIDGKTGAFFVQKNVDSLAENITRWFTLDNDRELIRKNCYEIIDTKYNPRNQITILNNLFNADKAVKNYNLIYITNLPSFYKINLFNRIAKQRKILVIFTHDVSVQRNADFYKGKREFESVSIASKSIFGKIIYILILLRNTEYKYLIIGGWDQLILWITAFTSPKNKNGVVVESSIFESETSGIKGLIKRLFLSRISKAYVSGKSQTELCKALGFKGQLINTKGVGIFNIKPQSAYKESFSVKNFIYVGRLSDEKNLPFLIETFNQLSGLTLNIIGFGPQEQFLKSIANENIVFHGAIPNSELFKYYQQNDIFILPSISEPWGMVVEEAFNNGLPVIVSDKVGCAEEIVNNSNGIIFKLTEPESLRNAILKMTGIEFYNSLRQNISKMDFLKIAEEQVNCYLK